MDSLIHNRKVWYLLLLLAGFAAGCSEADNSPNKPPASGTAKSSQSASGQGPKISLPELSAEELWAKVQATYAGAKSYADNTSLVQRGVNRARGTFSEVPYTELTLLFRRPNKYALSYEDAVPSSQGRTTYQVVSNGEVVRSRANEAAGQIHEALAPGEISLWNFVPEPQLRQALLQVAPENLCPQFALLVHDEAEKQVFPRATEMTLLPPESIDGTPCYRLQFTEPEGKRVLWIDSKRLVVLRMQLPVESQVEQLDPTGRFRAFSVDLDLRDVNLDPQIDPGSFEMEVPEGARLVRRFIPPEPDPLPELLGKKIGQFDFQLADGKRLQAQNIEGKVCVFDFWSTDCPPCRINTSQLEKAYQKLKPDHADLEFYAVSFDPPQMETDRIEAILKSWGGTFPVCRDPERVSIEKLNVLVKPTLLVTGTDGTVHVIHQGALTSTEVLERKLSQLLSGENVAEQITAEHEELVELRNKNLEAATLTVSLSAPATESAQPAQRDIPPKVTLERHWESAGDDVSSPQAIVPLVSQSGVVEEIAILDATRIVLLDAEGRSTFSKPLPEQAEAERGLLRTVARKDGKRWFLVSGVGWQRAWLFDQQWNSVLSFPDEAISGVGDVRLPLLSTAAAPSLVTGYWGGRGLERGTVDGRRLWDNKFLDHILQVTLQPAPQQEDVADQEQAAAQEFCCTSTRGTLFRVGLEGAGVTEIDLPGRILEQLGVRLAADSEDANADYCGLSGDQSGHHCVVDFDAAGEEHWSYDLPVGTYATPCDHLRQVKLPGGDRGWLVLAADSSFHILDQQGHLLTQWSHGEQVRDFAIQTVADHLVLYVASPESVIAWTIAWE